MARKPTWPRATCPECGRSIAVDWWDDLLDHNPVANGGGGLFRSRRWTRSGLCSGSGKRALPVTKSRGT